MQNGWVYLCCNCDRDVLKQCAMPEAFSKKKKKVGNPGTQGVATQNSFITLGEGLRRKGMMMMRRMKRKKRRRRDGR